MAERQREEANEQRRQAVHAKHVADTLNYISLGRTLGSQSFSIYRTGDTEIGNMLAYASYLFTRDYGGDLYASAVFQALIQSAGGRKSWSIHNGSVMDMDFFPGTHRMLTVSTCGEIMQHEMKNGHLTTKQLFSNKNYCFRDVIATKLGKGCALSHTGHLLIITPEKTEIIRLENLTKPFMMEYMHDGRQLLVIGERNLALVDLTTHQVTATRQLGFNIISASRRDNKPLLFDHKGHMHLVNSIDDIRDEKVPFEFTRHQIVRSQAVTEMRLPHSSLSKCKDRTRRFTFIVHESDLENFSRWLMEEAPQAAEYIQEQINAEKH